MLNVGTDICRVDANKVDFPVRILDDPLIKNGRHKIRA